jgi:hypothetical protein
LCRQNIEGEISGGGENAKSRNAQSCNTHLQTLLQTNTRYEQKEKTEKPSLKKVFPFS